jgi:hypothetical protein
MALSDTLSSIGFLEIMKWQLKPLPYVISSPKNSAKRLAAVIETPLELS